MLFLNSPLQLYERYIFKPHKDVINLFWSSVARKIAQTFIILFSSVYVYESLVGFGATAKNAMFYVVLFFTVFLATKLVFLIVAENISRRTGFKGIIWLSAVPFAVYLPSLIFADRHPVYFLLAAFLYGIHSAFYWWGYHGFFIKAGDSKHFGQGLGEIELLNTLALVITPLVGGIVIEVFGFVAGFVVAGMFMFLSLILLGKKQDRRQKTDVRFTEIINLTLKHKSVSLAYISTGLEGMFYIFGWPLFLLFFFGGIVELGTFVTVSIIIAAIAGVFVGKKIDEQGERGSMALASPFLSFSWLLKAASSLIGVLVIAESVRNFSERVLSISLIELSYKKAVEDITSRAILFREVNIIIGGFLSLLLFTVFIILDFSLQSFFVVIAVASLVPMIAVYKRKI